MSAGFLLAKDHIELLTSPAQEAPQKAEHN